MSTKQQIFDKSRKAFEVTERSGTASLFAVHNLFRSMRSRLDSSSASTQDRTAFVDAISRAIQNDPALAKQDRRDLQDVLRSAFDDTPSKPEWAGMAAKVSFLALVAF